MGACKYCGKKTNWFSHSHKECEEKHDKGLEDFRSILRSYFTIQSSALDIQNTKVKLMADAFLTEDEVCEIADVEIKNYTITLENPSSESPIKIMDDFLSAVDLSYDDINQKGVLKEFAKTLIRGYMSEYFKEHLTLALARDYCREVLSKYSLSQKDIEDAYFFILNKAITDFLQDNILTDHEQKMLNEYVDSLSLPINNLPYKYQKSEICKLEQISIFKSIERGVIPQNNIIAPVILGNNESILWNYKWIHLYQEKITEEWVGQSSGFNLRITNDVYYRIGQMKGHPVEHSSMERQCSGSLFITNKNIIFYSETKSLKISFDKIIGITPYSDGIDVHTDEANPKRIIFQGFDPWFIMNLLTRIKNV